MTAFRHIGFVTAAAISLAGCATRHPVVQVPEAPRSIVPVWKLETGDQVTTKIYREPELATQTVVAQNGEAYFPGLGRVDVAGLTMDSLQMMLTTRYDKLVIDAAVDALMMRDIVIYGQVRPAGEGRGRDEHRQGAAAQPGERRRAAVPADARGAPVDTRDRPR